MPKGYTRLATQDSEEVQMTLSPQSTSMSTTRVQSKPEDDFDEIARALGQKVQRKLFWDSNIMALLISVVTLTVSAIALASLLAIFGDLSYQPYIERLAICQGEPVRVDPPNSAEVAKSLVADCTNSTLLPNFEVVNGTGIEGAAVYRHMFGGYLVSWFVLALWNTVLIFAVWLAVRKNVPKYINEGIALMKQYKGDPRFLRSSEASRERSRSSSVPTLLYRWPDASTWTPDVSFESDFGAESFALFCFMDIPIVLLSPTMQFILKGLQPGWYFWYIVCIFIALLLGFWIGGWSWVVLRKGKHDYPSDLMKMKVACKPIWEAMGMNSSALAEQHRAMTRGDTV